MWAERSPRRPVMRASSTSWPQILVVMGVSGSGKSTVGKALAANLGWPFAEGDDFHSAANVAKMRSGQPLDDLDRKGWLGAISAWIAQHIDAGETGVVTCSALKRAYRDQLKNGNSAVLFVYLEGSMETIFNRLTSRTGHFMPASLLPTQFEALQEPTADENFIAVDVTRPLASIVEQIRAYVGEAR